MQDMRKKGSRSSGQGAIPPKEHDGSAPELDGSVVTLSADFICAMVAFGDKDFSKLDQKNKATRR
jgi:hypothetical protein